MDGDPAGSPFHPHQWPDLLQSVPGVQELMNEGFTPIETLFGEQEFAPAWPKEHRRVVEETRFALTGLQPLDRSDSRLYLVRSPWPSIALDEAVKLMRRWLRRNESEYLYEVEEASPTGGTQTRRRNDSKAELAIVRQFFRQSETWVRAYGRGRVNRPT